MPPDFNDIGCNEEYQILMSDQENIYFKLNSLLQDLGTLEFKYNKKRRKLLKMINKVQQDAEKIDNKIELFIKLKDTENESR